MTKLKTRKSKKQESLVRNRICRTDKDDDTDIIKECQKSDLQDLKIIKEIAKGTFGTVYEGLAFLYGENVPIIIKIEHKTSVNLMDVDYTYYMSDVGLGPYLYDAFFINVGEEGKNIVQFYIMERYDETAHHFLDEDRNKNRLYVVESMISLLYRQIYEFNLYCCDTKANNYVLKKTRDGFAYQVKLIDFGEFCKGTPFPKTYEYKEYNGSDKIDLFYFIQMTQLLFCVYDIDKSLVEPFKRDVHFNYIYNTFNYKSLKDVLGSVDLQDHEMPSETKNVGSEAGYNLFFYVTVLASLKKLKPTTIDVDYILDLIFKILRK